MITPLFHGAVNEGILQVENSARFYIWLASLEGKEVEIVVRKKRARRSLRQNRYYWGVVIAVLAEHCGYTSDEMHEALKEKFLGTAERDEHGLIKIGSTAVLSKDEFVQYTNRIIIWAAESLCLYIPDPSTVDY